MTAKLTRLYKKYPTRETRIFSGVRLPLPQVLASNLVHPERSISSSCVDLQHQGAFYTASTSAMTRTIWSAERRTDGVTVDRVVRRHRTKMPGSMVSLHLRPSNRQICTIGILYCG